MVVFMPYLCTKQSYAVPAELPTSLTDIHIRPKYAFISHGVRCIYPHKFACQWSTKQPGTLRSQQQPLVSRGSISYIRSTTVDFDLHVSGAAGHCHVNTICASHSTAYKVHMPNMSQMPSIDAFLRMLGIEPFRRVRRSNHTKSSGHRDCRKI